MSSDASGSAVPKIPRKRRRVPRACLPCRQRKKKCDAQVPCSMCTAYGYSCHYSTGIGPTTSFVHEAEVDVGIGVDNPLKSTVSSTTMAHEIDKMSKSSSPILSQGVLDPIKARYVGLHSSVAFARTLGQEFQSSNPPHIYSIAWNCGIRPEESTPKGTALQGLLSRDDFDRLAEVYFSTVHPFFGILDKQQFLNNCKNFWNCANQPSSYEAVIASVAALGSFFSATLGHPRESDFVGHAKRILEDPTFTRSPCLDQISAWILRTIYLRATTRPHLAWLATCSAMHLVEATGLHHEIDTVVLAIGAGMQQLEIDSDGCERARKIFWCAWMMNQITSYDIGLSSVFLSNISCQRPKPKDDDFTNYLIECALVIPQEGASLGSSAQRADLLKALAQLQQIPDKKWFITMAKADVCFCFYRRLRLLNQGVNRKVILQIIEIGNRALVAAWELVKERQFWWNVTSTVFQYLCVLLAMDSLDSLSNVSNAMDTLERICQLLGTQNTCEAVATARVLLRDSTRKKKQEVSLLEGADMEHNITPVESTVDIDWDALLDPLWPSTSIAQDYNVC